jgi:hypothetical protein
MTKNRTRRLNKKLKNIYRELSINTSDTSIDNTDSKNHTLNRIINAMTLMWDDGIDQSELVRKALRLGASINKNNSIYNTLTIALIYAISCIEHCSIAMKDLTKCENNLISLFEVLISAGAEPVNNQNQHNTLYIVILSKNAKLINFFLDKYSDKTCSLSRMLPPDSGPDPDNDDTCNQDNANTRNILTHAVYTRNLDIIKKIHRCFLTQPNCSNTMYNTLLCAGFDSDDPEIVKEIILMGGYFDGLLDYGAFKKSNPHIDIINLLLCLNIKFSGAPDTISDIYFEDRVTELDELMITRYCLEKGIENYYERSLKRDTIRKLRSDLQQTMDCLVTEYRNRLLKKENLNEILRCVPDVCVNIIFEYLDQNNPPFNVIDWNTYGIVD